MISFHFKNLLKKAFKWFLALLLGFLTVSALFNLVILIILQIAKYDGKLDELVRAGTGWQFEYQSLNVSWYNFDPGITLHHLSIKDPSDPDVDFEVNKVRIGLAIWPSILSMTPITSEIIVDGFDLNVMQLGPGQWTINGVKVGGAGSDSDLMQSIVLWLLNQKQIELTNLKLDFDSVAKNYSYELDPVNLLWLGKDHQFKLNAAMAAVNDGKFDFNGSFMPTDINNVMVWDLNFNGLISARDFSPLFLGRDLYNLQWANGGGEVAFSGQILQGLLSELQLNISLNNLNLMHQNGSRLGISDIDEQIYWKRKENNQGWQLHIKPTSEINVHAESSDLDINYSPNDPKETWVMTAQGIDFQILGQLINFWMSDQAIARVWNSVVPMGVIDNFDVEAGSGSGFLAFSGKNMSLSPEANLVFPQGWPASSINFKSAWTQDPANKNVQLNIDTLTLNNDHVDFSASGFINIPAATPANPYINIQATLQGKNLDQVSGYYIPQAHVPSGLVRWLNQGLVGLPQVNATLNWQGNLHGIPYADRSGKFNLEVDTENSTIEPWIGWPVVSNVNAKLLINNQKFTVDAKSAKTSGIALGSVHLDMQSLAPGHVSPIFITTPDLNLTGVQALNYLAGIPFVSPRVQDVLRNGFQITGTLPLSLSIEIPLHKSDLPPVVATGKVVFNGNNVYRLQTLPNQKKAQSQLWAQNIKGVVNFENQYLSSTQLNFGFREENFQVQIIKSSVSNLHILIPSLSLYGQNFSNVNAYVQAAPDNTPPPINNPLIMFMFSDPHAVGSVTLTPQGKVVANLDKFMIAPLQQTLDSQNSIVPTSTPAISVAMPAENTAKVTVSTQQSAEVSDFKHLGKLLSVLPAITLNAKNFYYGTNDLGSLLLITDPMADGIDIQRLLISNKDITFDVAGSIVGHPDQDEMTISGLLKGQNFGDFVTSLGYPNVLSGGSGTIQFTFGYFGALLQPLWPSFHGNINFNLANGKFLKVNAGIANVFGLVSFNTLSNIISLNFKNMSQQGLAFDNLVGTYLINQGVAHTDQLKMSGPVVNVLVQGDINFVNRTLDQKLIVQPQVGDSVALAAGILATPIAGAAVWVANEVLSNTILKRAGLIYHVQGSWDKPAVKEEDQNSVSGGQQSVMAQ